MGGAERGKLFRGWRGGAGWGAGHPGLPSRPPMSSIWVLGGQPPDSANAGVGAGGVGVEETHVRGVHSSRRRRVWVPTSCAISSQCLSLRSVAGLRKLLSLGGKKTA